MMDPEFSLLDSLTALARRWYLVVMLVALCGSAAAYRAYTQDELFSATAIVLVTEAQSSAAVGIDAQQAQRTLANEAAFARGKDVLEEVGTRLGRSGSASVRPSSTADLLVFEAIEGSPEAAANVANAHAESFVEARRQRVVDEYVATSAVVQDTLDALEDQLGAVANDDPGRPALERQRENLLNSLQQLSLGAELTGGTATQVLQVALPPSSSFQPTPRRDIAVGVAIGLLLGLILAFLVDFLDDKVRSLDDLEAIDPRLVGLAAVPVAPVRPGDDSIVSIEEPDGAVAEAYRVLRAAVSFVVAHPEARLLQVTSAVKGEGKSTTVANLAVACAKAGMRVIVVDGDLRRPRLHGYFRTPATPGLADVLALQAQPDAIAHRPIHDANLAFIAAGSVAPNPGELLSSSEARRFFDAISASADLTLVDSPPVLAVSDALPLAQLADATIVVAQSKKTRAKELLATLEALDRVDATVIGAVFNRDAKAGDAVYSQGYIPDAPKRKRSGPNAQRRALPANGHLHPREDSIALPNPSAGSTPTIQN